MIYSLKGKINRVDDNIIVVDVNGVGYEVCCSFNAIDEYINLGWDTDEKYSSLKSDIIELINRIEVILNSRLHKDVIMNWIDNVNAEEFYSTEFAKKRFEDSYVFMNAYTVTPWTHFTQNTIFTGKFPIEGRTYVTGKFDNTNSKFLESISKHNYKFFYIANPGMYQKQFDKEMLISYPKGFDKLVAGDRSVSECSTRLQWNLLNLRLNVNTPIFVLVHNLAETHPPYMFVNIDRINGERRTYRELGMHYISEQLDWNRRFYNDNVTEIYMADHGDGVEYLRPYEKGRTNIPIIIKKTNLPPKREEALFSHVDFCNLIDALLNDEKIDSLFKKHISYETVDFYNKRFICEHIINWTHENWRLDMAHFQCRGVRTLEDMYIKYAIGKELYFRLPDENTNLIDDEKWSSRIEELKKLCGDNFVDITKESLFENSHLLYDYLKLLPEEEIKW